MLNMSYVEKSYNKKSDIKNSNLIIKIIKKWIQHQPELT